MPRTHFQTSLDAVRQDLSRIILACTDSLRLATNALLDVDRPSMIEVVARVSQIEQQRVALERRVLELLARQQPVAGDLRRLVAALAASSDCERMAALTAHIARVAGRRYPACAIPDDQLTTFRRIGEVAAQIGEGAGVTLAEHDVLDAARLQVDDDVMDGLSRTLFRALLTNWPHGVPAAIDVVLTGRYYERFADHAVAIAQTVQDTRHAIRN